MPETTPLIKAALNLRGGAGFDVYCLKNEFVHIYGFFSAFGLWHKANSVFTSPKFPPIFEKQKF